MKDRFLILSFLVLACAGVPGQGRAQEGEPAASVGPAEEIVPTYETQKHARTYVLDIPAPRGQIVDRNGEPLAQNKLSYNLAVTYPAPLEFTDAQAIAYARDKIARARRVVGRDFKVSDSAILRHYKNRGILPFEIAQNLNEKEVAAAKELPEGTVLRPVYIRVYPRGAMAGPVIGYTGRTGRPADGIIENHETLWPETEGREGLELTFDDMLTGRHGEYNITFDKDGNKTSEKIVKPPVPGHTVVTTLDVRLQELAEKALAEKAKRGAIVITDPNTGDILALASWPTFDPNVFIPSISEAKFKELQDDPDIPLLPRAYRWPTRPARSSRSRSDWPRSRPAWSARMTFTSVTPRCRSAIPPCGTGKRSTGAR